MSISFTGAYVINTKKPEKFKQTVINEFHPSQPQVALIGEFNNGQRKQGNVLVLTGSEARDYANLSASFYAYCPRESSSNVRNHEEVLEKLKTEYAKNATYIDLAKPIVI